jgi:hypothetical protein
VKIAHKSPLSIFNEVQVYTDYEFVYTDLLANSEYLELIVNAIDSGRQVILSPGSLEDEAYYDWIKELNPAEYIVPYVIGDHLATIERFKTFTAKYDDLTAIAIAVPHGKTYRKYVKCYKTFNEMESVSKIAMSDDVPFFTDNHDETLNATNKKMIGRIETIGNMILQNVINFSKKHHLLGCELPQELLIYQLKAYKKSQIDIHWVESVNSISTIYDGINGIEYLEIFGRLLKDEVDTTIEEAGEWRIIQNNMTIFRDMAG